MLSGNGASIALQALYFLCMGRLLGASDYGAFVGLVALVNILSQFSSLGMDMVVLRTIARDREAYAATFGRALFVTVSGAGLLLGAWLLAACVPFCARLVPLHWRPLFALLPFLLLSDALCGRLTQLCSRALQGAELARWSAKLLALMNALRAVSALGLYLASSHFQVHVSVALWVRVYCFASLLSVSTALGLVIRFLGLPRWASITRTQLLEGLSFSFSSSSISVYNDLDKTMLVSYGMLSAAGIYTAAYRVVDVVSTPIISLFAAASPRLFRRGSQLGASAALLSANGLLRWAVPFGLVAAPLLALGATAMPHLFGHSFAGSVAAVRFLCLLPLLRALHYAWGTAITSCSTQWLRTFAQAGSAVLNLCLNLVLIPRWGWQGAAAASLLTDGSLALATFVMLRLLVARQAEPVSGSALSVGARS